MRVARFSWVLLPILVCSFPAGIVSPHAQASSAPDSMTPPILSSSEEGVDPTSRPLVATIHLVRGDSIRAAYVGPWAYDAVRYEAVDRRVGYLSLHQIARVVDAAGLDVTTLVTGGRKPFGSLSGERPPSFGSWLAGLVVPPVKFRPNREARTYTLVETSVLARGGDNEVTGSGTIFQIGLGGMRNLSRSWALGGIARLGGEVDDYGSADIGARVRYYLSDRWSLEATGGPFVAGGDRMRTRGVPIFAEAAITFADALAIVGRVERARWTGTYYVPTGWPFEYDAVRLDRTETVWRGGIRVGSSPKWLSVPALLIGALVLVQPGSDELYGTN